MAAAAEKVNRDVAAALAAGEDDQGFAPDCKWRLQFPDRLPVQIPSLDTRPYGDGFTCNHLTAVEFAYCGHPLYICAPFHFAFGFVASVEIRSVLTALPECDLIRN